MADQALYEMISAFAAGCMDKQNYMQFKDYLEEGGFLPKGELGELQNVVSMIPVILELEKPDPVIKDMVAKKLIGMKEEIKTKIIEEKKKTTSAFLKSSATKIDSSESKGRTLSFIDKKSGTTTVPFEFSDDEKRIHTTTKTKTKPSIKETEPPSEEVIESKLRKSQEPPPRLTPPTLSTSKPAEEIREKREAAPSGLTGWIALLLSIILFSVLGYFAYTSMTTTNAQIEDLKRQVTSLNEQIAAANNFVNNYSSLVEFFNYKDIQTTYITSSNISEKGSAKILLSFNEKVGLIQFNNAKQLQPDQSYQVWVVSKGQAYSLGNYQPKGSEFIKISSFPFLPKEKIESYLVTIETGAGTQSPSANIYLSSLPAKPNAK